MCYKNYLQATILSKVKQTHGKDSIYVNQGSQHLKKNTNFRWSLIKDDFLTEEECELLKEHIYESCNVVVDSKRNKQNKSLWNKYYDNKKSNVSLYDKGDETEFQWLVDKVWTTMKVANQVYWKYDIDGLRSAIGLYYNEGEHPDGGHHSDFANGVDGNMDTTFKLTGLLFLNDDFDGGELEIIQGKVKPKTGRLLMFPSFASHRVLKFSGADRYTIVFVIEGRVG